jgi:chromosome segregation ATPase
VPEDKEKVEDFISLWRKKMDTESNKPSAIGDTLKRIQEVEQENEQLRNKIQANIDLISKTEEVVRKTIDENEKLREEIKKTGSIGGGNVSEIQQQNLELSNKIQSLTLSLTEKENALNFKENEINELKQRLEEATSAVQFMADTASEVTPDISQELIEDLKSELSKKKSHVSELEQKNVELRNEISNLNEKLIDKETKSPVDYVIPVETPKSTVIKPQAAPTSSATLEILCQDLQADLNKYKKIVEKLNQDKSQLQQNLEQGGFQLEPEELKELKIENEQLRSDLSQVQATLEAKSKATTETLSLIESERLVEDLQKQLKQKDQITAELKTTSQAQISTPQGPMSNLVGDLQKTINKLKITIEEKNKIIDELKSS